MQFLKNIAKGIIVTNIPIVTLQQFQFFNLKITGGGFILALVDYIVSLCGGVMR
jgi:hypothetical protein